MYCPRCGQQQISEEMKFCSRCGLSISPVAEWLAGGAAPAATVARRAPPDSPRRKGIRRGAKLLFLSGVLFPVFLVISMIADEGAPMIVPFLIFFAALVVMVYSRLFVDNSSPVATQQTQPHVLGAMSQRTALPPPSNIPVQGAGSLGRQQVRTNELANPPSVTENTTKLLDTE